MSTVRIAGLEFYSDVPAVVGPLNETTFLPLTMFNTAFGCPENNMGASAEQGEITLGFPRGMLILFFRLVFKGAANTTYAFSVLAGGVPVRWVIEEHDPTGLRYLNVSAFGAAYIDPVGGVPIQVGVRTVQDRPGAVISVRGCQFFIQSMLP
jgi:hypothetical protein